MDFSEIKSVTIPEGEVTKITSGSTVLWEAITYKNWVKYSTEADDTTIYNGGLGYKNGYRLRSGGLEGEASHASHTGYIPIKANDIIYLSGYSVLNNTTANAINVYDSTHTNIGQISGNGAVYGVFNTSGGLTYGWSSIVENPAGIYKWIAPPYESIAYMRVTGDTVGDGSKMIVTVNEEIS